MINSRLWLVFILAVIMPNQNFPPQAQADESVPKAAYCKSDICVGDRVIFGGDSAVSQYSELRYAKVIAIFPKTDAITLRINHNQENWNRAFIASTKKEKCEKNLCVGDRVLFGGDKTASLYPTIQYGRIVGIFPDGNFAIQRRNKIHHVNAIFTANTNPNECFDDFCIGTKVLSGADNPTSKYNKPRAGTIVGIYQKTNFLAIRDTKSNLIRQWNPKNTAIISKLNPTPKANPKQPKLEIKFGEKKTKSEPPIRSPANH